VVVLVLVAAAAYLTATDGDEDAAPTTTTTPVAAIDLDPARSYLVVPGEGLTLLSEPADGSAEVPVPEVPAAIGGFFLAAPYGEEAGFHEVVLPDGSAAWVDAAATGVEAVNVVATATATEIDATGAGGGEVPVFNQPDAPEPNTTVANPVSADGVNVGPVIFLVHGAYDPAAEMLEVELPVRPNGTTGWVRASEMAISANRFRIEVGLGEHRIRVFDGGEVVLDEPIGVGTTDTPTPGGVFYIRSLIASTDPAYGTYAFGLSGFSDVHQSFNGGPGDIGIHGTNDPSTIGTDVSNGCIRLADENVVRLAGLLPETGGAQSPDPEITTGLGVPVQILA
jgi:lipoprotein-anchoring transpeptidase ErfK/SrfK